MKTCNRCFTEKPFTDFNKNKAMRDGVQGYCRTCSAQYYRTLIGMARDDVLVLEAAITYLKSSEMVMT